MGLCGSNDINVKDGLNENITFDLNGNKLDNTFLSKNSICKSSQIKTYNNNKIFELEIEASIGEIEYPIFIEKDSKIEINILEDKNYLWGFLPKEKRVDFKGYSKHKYKNLNLGCLLIRISTSHDYIPIDKTKFIFTSKHEGSLIIAANLDINNYCFYEPKGSIKLIVKGGSIYDTKIIDELTDYNYKSFDYKKNDEKTFSEINLIIARYINKARINIKKYIDDFILDSELPEDEDDVPIKTKKLSALELDSKLYKVAESHCNYLSINGTSGHIGAEGSTLQNRIEKQKIKSKEYAECIIYGYNNPISIINFLIINRYSKDKKERKILLNDKFKKIGISLMEHLVFGYCCVIVFSD